MRIPQLKAIPPKLACSNSCHQMPSRKLRIQCLTMCRTLIVDTKLWKRYKHWHWRLGIISRDKTKYFRKSSRYKLSSRDRAARSQDYLENHTRTSPRLPQHRSVPPRPQQGWKHQFLEVSKSASSPAFLPRVFPSWKPLEAGRATRQRRHSRAEYFYRPFAPTALAEV